MEFGTCLMILDNEINSILVSRLRFMGDVILTTPLLEALRKGFPRARITYLTERPYHTLLENHPCVDKILSLNLRSSLDQIKLFLEIKKCYFDIAIDLFGNPRSALLNFMSGARFRIGGDFRGRKVLYTHKIRDDGTPKTAVEFHMNYLRPIGTSCKVSEPMIVVTSEEKTWARRYLSKKGFKRQEMVIGIHSGGSWPAKQWFPERFAGLANRLKKETEAQILLTMGPGEEKVVQSVIKDCNFQIPEPEVFSPRQMAALLSVIDIFISNDCGPMHLAPAVGTKTVGVFGPGEPEIWFPYKRNLGHRIVHREIGCSRCHQDICDSLECMKVIQIDDVFSEVMDSLFFSRRKDVWQGAVRD